MIADENVAGRLLNDTCSEKAVVLDGLVERAYIALPCITRMHLDI